MKINFLNHGYNFIVPSDLKFRTWIQKISKEENHSIENIDVILTSRKNILSINKKFLNHNFYTDIITFDYSYKKTISGELFICVPVVRENAKDLKIDFEEEFVRVVFHGILHLLKYDDKRPKDIFEMRMKEDYYIRKYYLK